MYLCARLAPGAGGSGFECGFHGRDIIVRALSEQGFEAESRFDVELGAIVRLRLPGAGNVLARVTDCTNSVLKGDFVNPFSETRLRSALGLGSAVAAVG